MLEPRDPSTGVDTEDAAATKPERAILCAACGHGITSRGAKTSVGGGHTHVFKNPAGIDFHIACFREAPGARPIGAPSTVWTWFPTFAWQIALCEKCGTHVGWWFEGASSFVALALDRITED